MKINTLTDGVEFDPHTLHVLQTAQISKVTLCPTSDGAVNVEVTGEIECRNGVIQILGTFRVEEKS